MGAAIAWTEAGWADEALNTAFCALTYLCLPPPPPRSWQCRMRRLNEPETRRTLSPVRQPLPGAPRVEDKVEDLTSVYCDPGRVGSRAALQGSRAETRMSVLRTFRHSHTVSSQPYSFVTASPTIGTASAHCRASRGALGRACACRPSPVPRRAAGAATRASSQQ